MRFSGTLPNFLSIEKGMLQAEIAPTVSPEELEGHIEKLL